MSKCISNPIRDLYEFRATGDTSWNRENKYPITNPIMRMHGLYFVLHDTRLNTLKVSANERRPENLDLCLLFLSYLFIFDYYFVFFLPPNLIKICLDIQRITKVVILFKILHMAVLSTTSRSCIHLIHIIISCMYHFPYETIAIWICLMHLVLCPDIHPNQFCIEIHWTKLILMNLILFLEIYKICTGN